MIYKIKLINRLMLCGNKWKSEKILLNTLKKLQKFQKLQINLILKSVIINNSPYFNIKQVKKKKKKQIEFPFLLNKNLRISYSIKNLVNNKKNFYIDLSNSLNNKGISIDLKKKIHKDAFLKKKLANYRWF